MSGSSRMQQFAHQNDAASGGNSRDPSSQDNTDYVNVFVNRGVPPEHPGPPPTYASVHPESRGVGGKGGHPGTPAYAGVSPRADRAGGVDASGGSPLYASISSKPGGSVAGDSGTSASSPSHHPPTSRQPVFPSPRQTAAVGGWASASGPGDSFNSSPTPSPSSAANLPPTPSPISAASANPGLAAPLSQPSSEEGRDRKGGAGPTPEGKTPRHACLLPKPPTSGGARVSPRGGDSEMVVVVERDVIPSPPSGPARRPAEEAKPEVTSVPNTNIGVAIMVLLCFNLPLGLAAVFCSLSATRAYRDGHNKRGHKRARISIILSLIGIVVTVLIVMSVVLHMALSKQASSRSATLPPRRGQGF